MSHRLTFLIMWWLNNVCSPGNLRSQAWPVAAETSEAGGEVPGRLLPLCLGWACSCCWSVGPIVRKKSSLQSQEEWGQAGTCQHLRIGISLRLKQHDFKGILATISFTPSKSHTNFALNFEPFLLATCYRIKPPQEAKWGGFLACTIVLQIELSVEPWFASS